jgi:hypothetical protein
MRSFNAYKTVLALVATLFGATLFGASSASAFAVTMSVRPGTNDPGSLSPGDSVVLDFFLDADQFNSQLISFSVFFDDPEISYDEPASGALPIIYPAPPEAYGTTGGAPGYILYMTGMPPVGLYPLQNPFKLWIAPPAGKGQVNANWASPAVDSIGADTGSNVWVGSMVFVADDSGTLTLSVSNTTSIFRINNVVLDPSEITISGPIAVTVPEPAVASLAITACLATAFLAHRIRRRA